MLGARSSTCNVTGPSEAFWLPRQPWRWFLEVKRPVHEAFYDVHILQQQTPFLPEQIHAIHAKPLLVMFNAMGDLGKREVEPRRC